jgi:small subunit ribosomal protein S13
MKKKKEKDVPKNIKSEGKEIRGIIRISGKDVRGDLPFKRALARIKGVGPRTSEMFSEIILRQLSLSGNTVVGELSDEQIEKVEHIISNPVKYGMPNHLVNRRKDMETGQDRHLTGTDLAFSMKGDIEREKGINSWRGYRHMYGQKVRGQRTRSTGRTGMSVGVLRKSIVAKAGASAAPKKEEKK